MINALQQFEEEKRFNALFHLLSAFLIIAILVAIALNHYSDNVQKARLTQVYTLLPTLKIYFHEYYAIKGRLPTQQESKFFIETLANVGSMELAIDEFSYYDDGGFSVLLKSDDQEIDGHRLSLKPLIDTENATVLWLCGHAKAGLYAIPEQASVSNQTSSATPPTTLANKFLPEACRK